MSDTPDFRDLVGDDLTPRKSSSSPGWTACSARCPRRRPRFRLPHDAVERIGDGQADLDAPAVLVAVALAATLAALFFGAGRWLDRGFDARASFAMTPGKSAPQASGKIELGPRDDSTGNWKMRSSSTGFPTSTATTTTFSGSPRTASTRAPAGPSTSTAARPST